MKRFDSRARSGGFTLIEVLIVVVLLGVSAVGIGSMQGRIFKGQTGMKDLQVGTRLMQECAEQVLGVRRFTAGGYAAVTDSNFGTNLCGGVTAAPGYTIPSVSFTDPYTGASCPAGRACKLVAITQNGITPLTLMLVDY